jgi:Na+/H+-dicarboxylate symporter
VTQLDAVYRAFEKLISTVNLVLPLLVFAYAAQIASQWDPSLLGAMGDFLLGFWIVSGALISFMMLLLIKLGNATFGQVLHALKEASVLSLVSVSPLAAVPASIEGLSNRLGFSRGIVEMLMPISAVFLRTGAALLYAMLAVFVAHVYGHQITPFEMLSLAIVAAFAGLASAGNSGLASLSFAAAVVAHLQLPYEAALPLFAAIHIFCEGPARLLSLLTSCVLTVFVCGGLPKERHKLPQAVAAPQGPVRFSMTRQLLIVMVSCVVLSGLLSLILGFAHGLRQPASEAPTPRPISISVTPASTAA